VVQGLKQQVKEWFLPHAGQKPTWAPWTSANSLFCIPSLLSILQVVIWIGINDMGIGYNPQRQLKALFEAQDSLYNAGARNFVFFNVPPTDRSPAGKLTILSSLTTGNDSTSLRSRINEWNTSLVEFANKFRNSHDDVDVAIYDAAGLFNEVLDNPTKYGFKNGTSMGDSKENVWQDILHPTSAMHKVIAADVAKFLTNEEKKSA
jgi:phospholipase/lecithinase/hemolysin